MLSVKLTQPQQQPAFGNGAILAIEAQEYPVSGTIEVFSFIFSFISFIGQSEGKSLHSVLLTSKLMGHLLMRERQ